MSADGSGSDSGPGRREVAHRLFAAEFDDATVSYSESDEERAPKYVVTPTGARVNRLFAVGVLTEVESVNEEVLRARVVDPTGAFVSYAGQYQPDAAAFFERSTPPTFVALTGKARTFEPEDGNRVYTSVRPESVAEVDADTRDRFTVSAAEATLRRVAAMAEARETGLRGDELAAALRDAGYDPAMAAGIPVALAEYGTTPAYLDAVRRLALDALEVVAGDRDEVRALTVSPDEGGSASVGPVPESVRVETDDGTDLATVAARTTDAGEAVESTETAESGVESGRDTTDTPDTPDTADESAETPAVTDEQGESAQTAESAEDAPTDAETADDGGTGGDDESVDDAPTGAVSADDPETDDAPETETDDAPEPSSDAADDDIGDFESSEGMYELDEEERREVEEEYDVGFESGADVDDPGEADIDVPDADDVSPESAEAGDDVDASADATAAAASDGDADDEAESTADGAESTDDVDLESAAVEVMVDLDDGDGVDRETVVAAVVDDHGADPGAVDDAIQDALMSGRCYEPSEDTLKAI